MLDAFGKRRRPDAAERLVAIGLAGGRAAIGAGFWLAPDLAARALGLSEATDDSKAISRIAGTRDLILAAWHLAALEDRDRLRRASLAVAAADAGDTIAFALLLRSTEGSRRAAGRGLAAAFPATLAGLWLIDRLR
jgi:hypothetical protein